MGHSVSIVNSVKAFEIYKQKYALESFFGPGCVRDCEHLVYIRQVSTAAYVSFSSAANSAAELAWQHSNTTPPQALLPRFHSSAVLAAEKNHTSHI